MLRKRVFKKNREAYYDTQKELKPYKSISDCLSKKNENNVVFSWAIIKITIDRTIRPLVPKATTKIQFFV